MKTLSKDNHYICSICGRSWQEDKDGCPICCNEGLSEWIYKKWVNKRLTLYDRLSNMSERFDKVINKMKAGSVIPKVEMDENLAIPPEALEILRDVLLLGANKGKIGWWKGNIDDHIHCAESHLLAWKATEKSKHLNHAFTRLMMAAVIQHRDNIK